MASTLPHPHSADKPMFVPPQKRRTASGRTGTFTPSRSAPKSVIYGDQILNVQVWSVNLVSVAIKFMKMGKRKKLYDIHSVINDFLCRDAKAVRVLRTLTLTAMCWAPWRSSTRAWAAPWAPCAASAATAASPPWSGSGGRRATTASAHTPRPAQDRSVTENMARYLWWELVYWTS